MDKLDKIGWDGVRSELVELGFDAARGLGGGGEDPGAGPACPRTGWRTRWPTACPGWRGRWSEDLAATAASLDRLASERSLSWHFDPTLVRGMGYYTGQVFEIIHPEMSGSVAGGGRYDKLIGRSLGHDVPACGFSIGFERIVDLLSREVARDAVAVLVEAGRADGGRGGGGAGDCGAFTGRGASWRRCGGAGSSAPS